MRQPRLDQMCVVQLTVLLGVLLVKGWVDLDGQAVHQVHVSALLCDQTWNPDICIVRDNVDAMSSWVRKDVVRCHPTITQNKITYHVRIIWGQW